MAGISRSKSDDQEVLSPFAAKLAEAEPWGMEVDVSGFFTHYGAPMPKLWVRVPTKLEMIQAVTAAHGEADRIAKGTAEGAYERAIDDADILVDLKNAYVIHRCFFDVENHNHHAFPSPEWILAELDTDQIAVLVRFYNEARFVKGALSTSVDAETARCLRTMVLALEENGDAASEVLGGYDREHLAKLLSATCIAWTEDLNRLQPAK